MITKKQLEDLYWNKNLSMSKTASILNCSVTKVHYWILKYGVKRRKKFIKDLKITEKLLRELYVNQKLSLNEIASKFSCNNTNILYWLKKFDIPRRPANQNYIHIPKETLEQLYWKKNLTTSEIAKKFGIKNRRTVHKKLVKHGIKTKTVSQALTKKKKLSFSGSIQEKAYLLGLRTGDFHCKQMRKSIRIQTTSTHSAQIELLRNSVSNYGEIRVYLTKNKKRADEWFIYSDLHSSFDFLLEKPTRIPLWVINNDETFYNFLAAYADCEASFNIIKSHRNSVRFIFRISSQDKEILEQMKNKLKSEYYPRFYLKVKMGTRMGFGVTKKDIYELVLYRKKDVLLFIRKILKLSRHSEKIRKMNLILENKDKKWSEIHGLLLGFRKEIQKELLKNQLIKE